MVTHKAVALQFLLQLDKRTSQKQTGTRSHPHVLGDTPHCTFKWLKMAWNQLAEGLLYQPLKHTQTPHLHTQYIKGIHKDKPHSKKIRKSILDTLIELKRSSK
ncbi:hypothetical protein ILYODFUR_035656 [Ilyodon furcidens]|uniref:Uncharacterized protein n=1 Tax=Ilyodon furcidens TaxID=33524 RepID=A0ABV0V8U8_9TELE